MFYPGQYLNLDTDHNGMLSKEELKRFVVIVKQRSEPSQTFKMELFAKIVNSFQPSTIFTKSSILDV